MDRQAAIDHILDHYENPRNYGPMPQPTITHQGTNAGCGDQITLHLKLDESEHISAITFEGQGCTISLAGASILTEMVIGKSLDEVLQMDHTALVESMGEELVRQRLTCAMLGLDVLKAAGQMIRGQEQAE